jgi:hypothetical protein
MVHHRFILIFGVKLPVRASAMDWQPNYAQKMNVSGLSITGPVSRVFDRRTWTHEPFVPGLSPPAQFVPGLPPPAQVHRQQTTSTPPLLLPHDVLKAEDLEAELLRQAHLQKQPTAPPRVPLMMPPMRSVGIPSHLDTGLLADSKTMLSGPLLDPPFLAESDKLFEGPFLGGQPPQEHSHFNVDAEFFADHTNSQAVPMLAGPPPQQHREQHPLARPLSLSQKQSPRSCFDRAVGSPLTSPASSTSGSLFSSPESTRPGFSFFSGARCQMFTDLANGQGPAHEEPFYDRESHGKPEVTMEFNRSTASLSSNSSGSESDTGGSSSESKEHKCSGETRKPLVDERIRARRFAKAAVLISKRSSKTSGSEDSSVRSDPEAASSPRLIPCWLKNKTFSCNFFQ